MPHAGVPGGRDQVVHRRTKNSSDASSNVGELLRLTTTSAPASASGRPDPLSRSRPVDGECGTASCPSAARILTTCDPMSPVPPMTAIFMMSAFSRAG